MRRPFQTHKALASESTLTGLEKRAFGTKASLGKTDNDH